MELRPAIVIPAYNAQATLLKLIQRVQCVMPNSSIIVVDDGSTDGTKQCVNPCHITLLSHEKNLGKGAALRTGFEYVLNATSIEWVITLDADLQHIPEECPKFFEIQRKTNADIVLGYRKRYGTSMPFHRRCSNVITSFLVSARTGTRIFDSQCGFRMIRRTVLEHIKIQSDGYEAETEFLIKGVLRGFSVAHVPIQTVYGNEKSYMKKWKTTVNFLNVLLKDYS
ncbi:MAG: glycosyltransferase family 2 protein [Bacteroidetes bacterium]|nr:glycosyltransferase family 2 protein [Bacteroidota bacterium]